MNSSLLFIFLKDDNSSIGKHGICNRIFQKQNLKSSITSKFLTGSTPCAKIYNIKYKENFDFGQFRKIKILYTRSNIILPFYFFATQSIIIKIIQAAYVETNGG